MLDCMFVINEFQKSHTNELNKKLDEYFDEKDFLTNDEAIDMLTKILKNYSVVEDDEVLQFTISQIINLFDEDKNNQIDINELIYMMESMDGQKEKGENKDTIDNEPQVANQIKKNIQNNIRQNTILKDSIPFKTNKQDIDSKNENNLNIKSYETNDNINLSNLQLIVDDIKDVPLRNMCDSKGNSKRLQKNDTYQNTSLDSSDKKNNIQTNQYCENLNNKKYQDSLMTVDFSKDLPKENSGVVKENSQRLKKVDIDSKTALDSSEQQQHENKYNKKQQDSLINVDYNKDIPYDNIFDKQEKLGRLNKVDADSKTALDSHDHQNNLQSKMNMSNNQNEIEIKNSIDKYKKINK